MIKRIINQTMAKLRDVRVPAEPKEDDDGGSGASGTAMGDTRAKIRSKFRNQKQQEQRNVFLAAEPHESEEGGDEGGDSGIGSLLPESEYYDVHELIRSKHKGRVEAGRKFHEPRENGNTQTADFNDDMHPLAAMAYFSGIDNRDETPLPGESTDEEAQEKLELTKRLQLQKQLGISNTYTPTPKPF